MNSSKINDWVQIVGIFALVASLIFVGLQIKQAQEIAESNAYQSRAAMSVEFSSARASSPEFLSAMARIYAGRVQDLTAEEEIALEYFFGAEMTMFENLHFQHALGYIPEEHWQKNLAELQCNLSLPYYRELAKYYEWRKSFRAVVDEIIAEVTTNPGTCWD